MSKKAANITRRPRSTLHTLPATMKRRPSITGVDITRRQRTTRILRERTSFTLAGTPRKL
jgi:hypothetical protein